MRGLPFTPVDTGDPDINRELNMLLGLADDSPRCWWWLSFVDPDRPEGDRFLGVSIVEANNEVTAASRAHELGCNPGGEIALCPIPSDHVPGPEYRDRLLTRDEAEIAGSA
jgi:hypothetical protein